MLINEIILPVDEGVHDPHIFKAVFMAGSPGAGKSTIANKLFAGTGLNEKSSRSHTILRVHFELRQRIKLGIFIYSYI